MAYSCKCGTSLRRGIVLFLPPDSPAIREVKRGFLETLFENQINDYKFIVYNATSDTPENEKVLKYIIRKDCELIFTIGIECTKIAKRVTVQENKFIPIVFCGVANQVKEGLTKTKTHSHNHLTGTFAGPTDLAIPIRYLLWLKPDIKKIVCLYDASFGNNAVDNSFKLHPKTIMDLKQKKNVIVKRVTICHENEITSKLSDHLGNIDAIITTRGHLFFSQIKSLIALTHQYNVILCSSDLESVKQGATLGVGDSEYNNGATTALNYALPILCRSAFPAQLPLTKLAWNYKLMLNTHSVASLQKSLPFMKTINKIINLKNGLFA